MLSRLLAACLLSLLAAAATAAPPCNSIDGLDQHVLNAPGLVVGEMHGTVEAPAFLGNLVCRLLRSDRAVLLALEYPAREQRFLDDFLHAPGATAERTLLASPFWSRSPQDGRTSRAMLDLMLWVRGQVAQGARIRVVAIDSWTADTPAAGAHLADERDAAMAATLDRALSTLAPGEIPVIYAGQVHVRKTKGLPFIGAPPESGNVEPLGYRLKDRGFLHLNIGYHGGTGWVCLQEGCGVHEAGTPGPAVRAFSITSSSDPAYDAEYFVGRITASPPANGATATP
jgi:erythromycin esterase-like protein